MLPSRDRIRSNRKILLDLSGWYADSGKKYNERKKFQEAAIPTVSPEASLATRAAWLSFVGGYTQGQIAARLGVSAVKVHRLIAQARQLGLVKVFVEGAPVECIEAEDVLARRFGLRFCTVVPNMTAAAPEAEDSARTIAALGAAGARFLAGYLEQDNAKLIGVGHGRTLAAIADQLPTIPRPDHRFVSLIGSLTRRAATNPFDVIHRLAERTGGEGYFLPVPFIADSVEAKQVLMAQQSVRAIVKLAREAEMFMVGIGELGAEAHMKQVGQLTAAEYSALREAGAVGDLIGHFLDAEGRPVDCEVNDRTLGLRIEDLRDREVIAVAGGAGKRDAILAALRSGVITGLITDEVAAQQIVALERDARSTATTAAGSGSAGRRTA